MILHILVVLILLCIGLLFVVVYKQYSSNIPNVVIEEGFDNLSDYNALRRRLASDLGSYCSLATFVQAQMKQMLMSPKPGDGGAMVPGDSEADAMKHMQQIYSQVYTCTDDLASSRPGCAGSAVISAALLSKNPSETSFIPCSTYLGLPDMPSNDDTSSAAAALTEIPNNLADRILKEVDWYGAVIKKLQDGLDAGANIPDSAPTGSSALEAPAGKSWNSDGKPFKKPKEGFADSGVCTPSEIQARKALLARKKLEASSGSCTMPNIDGEIARVNKLLDSGALKAALRQCAALEAAARKLQSDLEKLKAGNLYDWQKDGPRKSYSKFKGGDRVAALTFSMQQNR